MIVLGYFCPLDGSCFDEFIAHNRLPTVKFDLQIHKVTFWNARSYGYGIGTYMRKTTNY